MPPTREQIVKIHIARNELGMDEESYRCLLAMNFGGRTSCKELSEAEAGRLLGMFRARGWKPKTKKRASDVPLPDDAMSRKCVALWITLHKAGVVRQGSTVALMHFVKRVTGVDLLQWCAPKQKLMVIEALKNMQKRAEAAKKAAKEAAA